MSETQSIQDQIRDYILSEFLQGESKDNLQDDTPLRTSGILDSMATLRLVAFVEQQFGVELEAHEVDIENFDRICDIAALVDQKRTTNV